MRSYLGGSEHQDNDYILTWLRETPDVVAKEIHEWANDWTFEVTSDLVFKVFRGYVEEYADARAAEMAEMEPCYD